jgi:type III restriction enzyme
LANKKLKYHLRSKNVTTKIINDANFTLDRKRQSNKPCRKDSRIKNFTKRLMDLIGNMFPIPDKEIEKYINRILEDFSDEQFNDLAANEYTYKDKIKFKIIALSEVYAGKKFRDFLDTDKVFIKPAYHLPKSISPIETSKDITLMN